MLFLNSDCKNSYYTVHLVCLWIAITSTGFPIKIILAQAPVKWQILAVYPCFKCYVRMCAWSYGTIPWLEPCVFPDDTILSFVFPVYTHTSCGTTPCPFCADLSPAAGSVAEAGAAAGQWSLRAPQYWSGYCQGSEKADISWKRLPG